MLVIVVKLGIAFLGGVVMLKAYFSTQKISPRRLKNLRLDQAGTAVIEFAIVAPIFVLLVMGMVAYGIYFGASHSIAQISADAARVALDDSSFAYPVRITATVRMGEGELVDIEREVELGGPIHSKGVLILAAFLAARFGSVQPLSLKASLVFEQSYGGVEGDSASLAEVAALLSALAGVPIRQGLAVTGSVNQFGVVQPVGGINDKIEGFFDICAGRGLAG